MALVSGPVHPKPEQPIKLTSKQHFNYDEHPIYTTMNTFYPRTVFETLGGFDASLCVRDPLGRAVEAADPDLAWRVIKAGYAKRFVREAIVYHEVEDLGLVGYILEGSRYIFVPEIVRRYPELRSELLTARLFIQPSMWLVYSALIIILLAAKMQPWLLAALPLMLLGRALLRTRSLRRGDSWVVLCRRLRAAAPLHGHAFALIYGTSVTAALSSETNGGTHRRSERPPVHPFSAADAGAIAQAVISDFSARLAP